MILHYWIGNKIGYAVSTNKNPPFNKSKERIKYIGYTEDETWPKRMNTGRVFYAKYNESNTKEVINYKKRKKLSNIKTTGNLR